MQRKKRKPPERARRIDGRLEVGEGLAVSPVCLGWVGESSVIGAAYDAGINFFFLSADMHFPLYEAARKGLADLLRRGRGVRENIVVGVVSYVQQPEFCHAPFRELIDAVPRLGTIDMTIAGGAYAGEFLVRLSQYRQHRVSSRSARVIPGVRATGASFHDRVATVSALNHDLVDLAFSRYNPDHPGAEEDVFPHLVERRRSRLFNFNSTRGHVTDTRWKELGLGREQWHPKVIDHYRFALRRPEIDGILCGLENVAELEALEAAFRAGGVTEEEAEYMRDLADLAAGRRELARD
jgi:hypothetical protein